MGTRTGRRIKNDHWHYRDQIIETDRSPLDTGGSLTVDNQSDPPTTVTTLVAPGATLDDGTASLVSIVVSEDDPGAIGPRNLWLETAFANASGDGGYGRLWVRNSTDDGWNSGSPMSFADPAATVVASPADNTELSLKDAGPGPTAALFTTGDVLLVPGPANKLAISVSGTIRFSADAAGVHLGDTGVRSLLYGTDDPSAGAGQAAPVGSTYSRDNAGTGELWVKTGSADTAWQKVTTA